MNELKLKFNQNLLTLANVYNAIITQIKRSRMSLRLKNMNMLNVMRNYNNDVASLKTKYLIDVSIIQQQEQQQQQQQVVQTKIQPTVFSTGETVERTPITASVQNKKKNKKNKSKK